MTESERREVEPLVEGMILAWHERRKNEKTCLDSINHEVKDMLKTYLDRIYHEVLDMLKTYLERRNHESRESARPQSEENEGVLRSHCPGRPKRPDLPPAKRKQIPAPGFRPRISWRC